MAKRERPLWVKLGLKLDVRVESAIRATTDILSVVSTSGTFGEGVGMDVIQVPKLGSDDAV
jgi:hypothetical protein